MTEKLRFTVLGCGSSGGVPRVGNQWGACDPQNPLNKRRRCSLLVESFADDGGTTTVLIDTGADLREQLLSANVMSLDGVFLSHPHADHIFGLDDLRQLAISLRSSITVHMDQSTESIIMQCFGYCFRQAPGSSYPPFCQLKTITHGVASVIDGDGGSIALKPLVAEHGDIHALGFRVGDVAYLPDMKRISDEASLQALLGCRILIVDALRYQSHPSHMNLEESLAFIDSVGAEHAILTNLATDMDYETLKSQLPAHVIPAHDGLQLIVDNK